MTNTTLNPATPLNPRKHGIIVGAVGGIGSALSMKLAREGYTLALLGRNKKALQSLCAEINKSIGETRAKAYEHDVLKYDSIPALLRTITKDLGGLDLFVFAPGAIYFPKMDEFNFAEDSKMIQVNTISAIAWLSEVAPLFQSMKGGQIVGISSVAGDRGRVGNPGYNASKAAFTSYLESLRNRLTRHGVNVITVKPGFVKTKMIAHVQKTPFAVTPEKVADVISMAIRKRKQTVYVADIWQWVMLVIRHIPSFIFRRLSF